MMLTVDTCYTVDYYENKALPGLVHRESPPHRGGKGRHAPIGHDPDAWSKFKKVPDYYA